MSNSKIRQDLPPPGGYKPIQYLRIPAKTYFSGLAMFLGFGVMQAGAIYLFSYTREYMRRNTVEERSTRLAMLPLLLAEKERLYLKHLRRNRDEERRLMKDVEGWEVGTYWGEPTFYTRPANEWHDPILNDYYAHVSDSNKQYAYNFYKYF